MNLQAPAVALVTAMLLTCAPSSTSRPELLAADPPERGRYLALHVSLCVFCHSEIDWKGEGFPPRSDAVAAGRSPFSEPMPWLSAPGLAGRTRDEIERALRRGVGRDGRPLHPAMPSAHFRKMSDDDVDAIAEYLGTLPAAKRPVPPSEIPEEVRATLRPLTPETPPARPGEYLAAIAACGACHTPTDERGRPIEGMELAGGQRLKGPWGDLHAPNITPDASGIEHIGEKGFVHAMKTGQLPGRTLNAIMPWGYYRRMTDGDLRALYAHLMTLKPVRHYLDNRVAPTPCRKCGRPHGLGNRN